MARKSRMEFEGAFDHVIVRGNQRLSITMCSWADDSVHTPINSKARANRRG
jgi:hypothetical protein